MLPKSWYEAGLPLLESENVPFPTYIFCFRRCKRARNEEDKTLAKVLQSEKDVVKFMTACMKLVISLVVDRADRFSTVSTTHCMEGEESRPILQALHPFSESKVIEESRKMMADTPEWTKYLVFIYANSHSFLGAVESVQCGDVQCLALSCSASLGRKNCTIYPTVHYKRILCLICMFLHPLHATFS